MNDYEKLKNLLQDTRSIRSEFSQTVTKVNKLFELFEDMNNDCDEELDEIDEKIEELQDEADEGSREKQDIQLEIKKLKEQRILVEQAVDIFDEIIAEFEKISEISEDLDVGF